MRRRSGGYQPLLGEYQADADYSTIVHSPARGAAALPEAFPDYYKKYNVPYHLKELIVNLWSLHGICSSLKFQSYFTQISYDLVQLLKVIAHDETIDDETLDRIRASLKHNVYSIDKLKKKHHKAYSKFLIDCIAKEGRLLNTLKTALDAKRNSSEFSPIERTGISGTPDELRKKIDAIRVEPKAPSHFHFISHAWSYSEKTMQTGLVLSFCAFITTFQSIVQFIKWSVELSLTGRLNLSNRSPIDTVLTVSLVYILPPLLVEFAGLAVMAIGICKSYQKHPSQPRVSRAGVQANPPELPLTFTGGYNEHSVPYHLQALVTEILKLRKICSLKYKNEFENIYTMLLDLLKIIASNDFRKGVEKNPKKGIKGNSDIELKYTMNSNVISTLLYTINNMRNKRDEEFENCIINSLLKKDKLIEKMKYALGANREPGKYPALEPPQNSKSPQQLMEEIDKINAESKAPSCCHFIPHAWTYSNTTMQAGLFSFLGGVAAGVQSIALQLIYFVMANALKNSSDQLSTFVYFGIQALYFITPLSLGTGITTVGIFKSYPAQKETDSITSALLYLRSEACEHEWSPSEPTYDQKAAIATLQAFLSDVSLEKDARPAAKEIRHFFQREKISPEFIDFSFS